MSAQLTFISYFSGIGGLDLGLERAGWNPIYLSDSDPACIASLRANFGHVGESRIRAEDICETTPATVLQRVERHPGEVDLVVGGPPCQSFSTAGRRGSLSDPRGNASLAFLSHVAEIDPPLVLIENVRGLLSAPIRHVPHSERDSGWEPNADSSPGGAMAMLTSRLQGLGYKVSFALYDAANFGVPQKRERVFVVGCKEGRVPLMFPTHQPSGAPFRRHETVRSAWSSASIPPESPSYEFTGRLARLLEMVPPGGNWRNLPERFHKEALGNAYFAGGGKTGFLRRLPWDAPSPTLVTSPRMPATLLAHPEEPRTISVAESAALQQFPSDWEFSDSPTVAFRQVGNAVPVGLAEAIGTHLIRFVRGDDLTWSVPESSVQLSRYRNTTDGDFARAHAALTLFDDPAVRRELEGVI